jgi:hypothetical protein
VAALPVAVGSNEEIILPGRFYSDPNMPATLRRLTGFRPFGRLKQDNKNVIPSRNSFWPY